MADQIENALQRLTVAQSILSRLEPDSVTISKKGSAEDHIDCAIALCAASPRGFLTEPIRTIHHLSCTGGTLLTKCIAAMSNVMVLNEVDLHSNIPASTNEPAVFTPTDMIALLRQSETNVSADLISKVFLADLVVLREEQWKVGRSIVLRDHSHSHFLTGESASNKPTLREIVASKLPTVSLVTVRNPFDSFASMKKQGWHTMFTSSTFEEYCDRYNQFLDAYEGIPIIKYEEFSARPKSTMRKICSLLDLRYNPRFDSIFSAFKFSGDSGRSSNVIKPRPPRDSAREISSNGLTSSQEWLLKRLGYEQ